MEKQIVVLETNWDVLLFSILMMIDQFVQSVQWNLTSFVLEKFIHYTLTENNLYLRILNYFTDIRPVGREIIMPMK